MVEPEVHPPRIVLRRVPFDPAAWDAIVAAHPEAEVYHSTGWLEYLSRSQAAEPVVAEVWFEGRRAGHFVGAIVRRGGIRILGSPLRGWTTQCMGFLLDDGIDRRAVADALPPFAFHDLRCLHVELSDRRLGVAQMTGARYQAEVGGTYVVDLEPAEDVILGRMRATTRNYIRQATRDGVVIEQATGEDFADDYYEQLADVFGRQGLGPTYGIDRVRQLISALQPTGQLLLLRARESSGACVATLVSVGRGTTAVLWGVAFSRSHTRTHPNELLHWEAIRRWRAMGATRYDMGGGGAYKAKYGGSEAPTVHFYCSRWGVLGVARSGVRRIVLGRQIISGTRRRLGGTGGA